MNEIPYVGQPTNVPTIVGYPVDSPFENQTPIDPGDLNIDPNFWNNLVSYESNQNSSSPDPLASIPQPTGPLFYLQNSDGSTTPQYDYSNMNMAMWNGFWSNVGIGDGTTGSMQTAQTPSTGSTMDSATYGQVGMNLTQQHH